MLERSKNEKHYFEIFTGDVGHLVFVEIPGSNRGHVQVYIGGAGGGILEDRVLRVAMSGGRYDPLTTGLHSVPPRVLRLLRLPGLAGLGSRLG